MRSRIGFVMCAAALLAANSAAVSPATAKSGAHHGPQARPHYNYGLGHPVREGFREMPRDRYTGREDFYSGRESAYRQSGLVVENLRGDFTGGVGAGGAGDYFIDGYGQAHFFVGSFRALNPLPHGPYGPQRFAPGRRF